jgi:hypothetical protein
VEEDESMSKDPRSNDPRPDEDADPTKLPGDRQAEWAEEDRELEDRKPDLGEIEEDTSEF